MFAFLNVIFIFITGIQTDGGWRSHRRRETAGNRLLLKPLLHPFKNLKHITSRQLTLGVNIIIFQAIKLSSLAVNIFELMIDRRHPDGGFLENFEDQESSFESSLSTYL